MRLCNMRARLHKSGVELIETNTLTMALAYVTCASKLKMLAQNAST